MQFVNINMFKINFAWSMTERSKWLSEMSEWDLNLGPLWE